jgi:hypothetical protein
LQYLKENFLLGYQMMHSFTAAEVIYAMWTSLADSELGVCGLVPGAGCRAYQVPLIQEKGNPPTKKPEKSK